MEAFLVSAGVVAIGEIGDKTQLLSLVLAARYRAPWPILAGIVAATLVNHALAAWAGDLVRAAVPPELLRWLLAAFFLAEMGDKTQVATVMLAARFHALWQVIVGTTLGMVLANAPVVFAGKLAADRIPFKAIRIVAALLFAAI